MDEADRDETPGGRRKAAFLALVEAQDLGQSVADSRQQVGEQFGLSPAKVRAIEAEGIRKQWPPL